MPGWSIEVRKRADREHARKKAARKQQRHLRTIKSKKELRRIMLAAKHKTSL